MPAANATPDAATLTASMELGRIRALLEALLAESRSQLLEVGVSDALGRELVLDQFPVAGSRRALSYRTGNGSDAYAVPTTGVVLTPANEARLGCQFVNSGANAVILYLSDQQRKGVPCVWLAAGGGAWDGRFGNLLWAGNVFAVAQTGPTTLVGGEF
jgi:hypothetical protein